MITQRQILGTGAAVLAATLTVAGCSDSGEQSGGDAGGSASIVVSTFPFGVEEFTQAVLDPFTEATGIEVEIDTGSNADRLSQLSLADGSNGVDVMLISDTYAGMGEEEGLFQPVTAADVPTMDEIAPFAVSEQYSGPAYSYQLNGTMYNTDELTAEEAASWDLYANADYAGRLALPDISVTAGQLMVSGVAASDGSGPYDVDAAFATLGEWAPNILQFYSSTTEMTNLLTQGEIVAGDALNGFATELVAAGEPIAWTAPAQGRYMATNRAMIPVGAENVEGATKFIDFLLGVEAQQASAEIVGDLPVNLGIEFPQEIIDVVGDIAQDPTGAGYETLDPREIVPNRDVWVERFAREVVGG
ncbi:extracellular solute-binding protein [Pseudactinotalea sp. HY160]|uniref:extracellular solute-binding protein n=1 Tax=Pseudactinotalea sp. HY160 TaxID=2654490 RepID=UPI00128E6A8F|nr:extracellular solute-binding protein [Pseudactinotalea sp. HY160]MPV50616.1 extracellular solute-binding protein [Pseudactinotalea sp. HY160]